MAEEIYSNHPVVKAIISGSAPAQARMAAAKGILPLPPTDLLEALAHLAHDSDAELARTARETFAAQENLLAAVESAEIAPTVLGYIAETPLFSAEIYTAVVVNVKTPDMAVVKFASATTDGTMLELAAFNEQRLIRTPAILDAILANPARTSDVERRAREIRTEFFEKERGAEQIAAELRARGQEAAAEFIEQAEFAVSLSDFSAEGELSIEDAILLASHIEVPDNEIDDSWLSFNLIEQLYEESDEQRRALAEKIISESVLDGEAAPDRIALIKRIMLMKTKDRVKLAMKGDREARSILIRDSNKIVSAGVLQNPRITENEVEKISAMRTVPDEILRTIGINRTWARNYMIIHNLARNPRTPMGTAMTVLTRIQTKDLKAISTNRNVSEPIRKQAFRLLATRK